MPAASPSIAHDPALDSVRLVETPEGVSLRLAPAGPLPRALAWLLDALLRTVVYVIAALVLAFLGDFGGGLMLIVFFLMEWFYPVVFEVLRDGATPGKRTLGLRVVSEEGVPVSWSQSLVRNLLRVVDFLPLLYGFGLISMLLNGNFQRLGDLVAHTMVVYESDTAEAGKLPEGEVIAPALAFSPDEAQALMAYAERRDTLSDARASELADLLRPLLPTTAPDPSQAVMGVARWLAGGR
ncbi:MAG: RDD family protein [Chromatiales bacterium]|nr:RDD family protein [Chromatiales bacterium]